MGQISKMKLGVNLQILKILRGQIIIFEKIERSIYNFLEIYCDQIGKFEDQNAKFEKL